MDPKKEVQETHSLNVSAILDLQVELENLTSRVFTLFKLTDEGHIVPGGTERSFLRRQSGRLNQINKSLIKYIDKSINPKEANKTK